MEDCRTCEGLMDERDQAEAVIDKIKGLLGIESEWSNAYDYNDFLVEVEECLQQKDAKDGSWGCKKCGAYHYYIWDECQYCGESR